MLDWDLLRFVLAVEREGSFTAAAQALKVSNSTVTRQLDRAEEILKAKLFDRRHTGAYPTASGAFAVKIAEDFERQLLMLHEHFEGTNLVEEGKIRLSVPQNVLPFGFVDNIREFRALHPGVTFEVQASDQAVSFGNREAEVVIRVSENPPPSLWGFKIVTVQWSFFATKGFMDEWGKAMIEDPLNAPIPFVTHLTSNASLDRDAFWERFPNAQLVAECDGLDSLIPLVTGGIGAGRMMRYMPKNYPDLVKIFDCDERSDRSVWILTHSDLRDVRRIRLFMEFVRDSYKDRANSL